MSYQGNKGNPIAYLGEGGALGAGIAVIAGTAANQVKLPTAANQMPVGVTFYATAAAGDVVEVIEDGCCDLVVNAAGTAIAVNDPITVHGTTGRGSKADLTNTKNVFAVAREAASADGVTISVRITRNFMPSA